MCIAKSVASDNYFPPPTYWPVGEAVLIETSGAVEFEGIRFDFATKGLIGLTVRRRRVLSSRRVLVGAASQTQVESAKMPDRGLWLRFPEISLQVGLRGGLLRTEATRRWVGD